MGPPCTCTSTFLERTGGVGFCAVDPGTCECSAQCIVVTSCRICFTLDEPTRKWGRNVSPDYNIKCTTKLTMATRALEEEVTVDASLPAQIAVIEKSFAALPPLNTVTHPTRKDADGKPLTAATSFELLPDVDIWANPYLQIRFIERPGERPLDVGLVYALVLPGVYFVVLGT